MGFTSKCPLALQETAQFHVGTDNSVCSVFLVRLATDQSKIPNQTKRPDSKRKRSTQAYTKVEAPISVFTLPVSEPFLLKFRSKIIDKEFRTKIHYYSCQANYMLTAWDFVAVRKSIFTWKTELCSTKFKTIKFGVDQHGLHVLLC